MTLDVNLTKDDLPLDGGAGEYTITAAVTQAFGALRNVQLTFLRENITVQV